MPTLSSILVQRGAATMRAVEDAIARQVLHGGDLPTNLLELGSVDEAMLTAILAESFGLDPAPTGKLHAPAPAVIRLIPVDLAHRHSIFPIAQPGRQLIVAAAEPLTAAVRDDLGFALDLEIITRIALLVRVRQALAEHYAFSLDRRFQRLVTKLGGVRKPEVAAAPPPENEGYRVRPPQAISVPAPSFGTGVSSAPRAFQEAPSLEAHAALVRPSRGRLEDVAALKTPIKAALAAQPLPVIEVPDAGAQEDVTPPADAPQGEPPPAAGSPAARAPAVAQALAGWVQHEIKNERTTTALLDKTQPRPAVRAARRKGPFTAAMAEDELEAAETTDAVLDVAFAFSAQFFEYCALFAIQGELAEGRDAAGPGAGRERVMALGVPLDLPSSFERLRRRRAPMVGPLDDQGLDADVLRDLGRSAARAGRSVALLPILIRTRVVAILFGDDGDADVTLPALGDVIVFTALAARALERILVRKKLGSRAPDMPLRPPSGAPDAPPPLKTPMRPDTVSIARMRALVEPPGARDRAGSVPVAGAPAPAATPKNEGDYRAPPDLIAPLSPPQGAASAADSTPPEDPDDRPRDTVDWSHHARAQVAIAASPEGDVDADAERGDRTTWVGMAPSDDDDEDDHAHMPMGERPTYRKLRVPRQAEESAENRARRGPAPAFEGRAAALPPPPTPLSPLPRTPPSNATAWTTFPSQRPAPLSLLRRPPTSDRPIPREDIDSSPGVSFVPALEASPISPSLVSDAGAEYVALIQRVIDGGPGSQEAFDELVRHGEHALQALMAKFPGPLRVDRHRAREQLPAASQCGPILELLVTIRRPALPFVSGRASSMDPEIRFWATHLLGELRYAEAATVLIPRLFDEDAGVRRIARRSASALVAAGPPGEPILLGLDNITRNPDHPSSHRIIAIETIAEIRSGAMVPALIAVLEGRAEDVADAARRALVIITRQDHARDVRRWHEWLSRNVARHRIEWLIDALMHEQPSLRRAAGDELKLITKEYFGYYDDLPKKERERAQSLYRTWWEREGKPRFS